MSDTKAFTILLVDDNDVIQEACGSYLVQQGYRVVAASSGQEALETLESASVDAVLLDVMMPGLSGFEVLQRLRSRWPPEELPVIMATAKDQNADVIRAFALGASDYVTKPLDYPVLSVRLRAQLRSKIQSQEPPPPPRVTAEDLAIQTGAVLDGKYRLESLISQGKFGIVYQARHVALDRLVAVKLLGRDVSGGERRLRRFRSEGISACRIDHRNAVSVLDSSVTVSGVPFLVMELLQGETLDQAMRRKGRLPPERCAEIVLPICDVLAESHALGIVHRDIKPSNIFLHQSRQGEVVKVLDFGIAMLADEANEWEAPVSDDEPSADRSIVGTPIYMAPERFTGETPDGRTDVYSLGVMLYEMLAGQLPFGKIDGNPIKVMHQHLHEEPVPLATLCPELAPELCQLVHETLSKDPEGRPTALQLGRRLAAILGVPFKPSNNGLES